MDVENAQADDQAPIPRKQLQLNALAEVVAELRNENRTMLLRDVYYFLKRLFRSQNECNERIFELGSMLGLRRHEMNIIPSAKGLISGPIRVWLNIEDEHLGADRCWIDCRESVAPHGVLIDSNWIATPLHAMEMDILDPRVEYVLVVEKEAIFHRLLEDRFAARFPCIMIASCGYPDISTRAAVGKIARTFPALTVVGLCDYNPHGLALLLCFRFPSAATAMETINMNTPIRWLGLRSHHIRNMHYLSADFGALLQPHTENDTQKLASLLTRDEVLDMPAVVDELHTMVAEGVKCELEALYHFGLHMVTDFVAAALRNQDFI